MSELSYLRNKRILVTGATGFLGGHLMERLGELELNASGVGSTDFDLTRADEVERLYATQRPQVVIHAAAVVGGIGANQRLSGLFTYANLMMGALMIEGARRHGLEKFVAVGTVCGYPKHTPVPFRERDLWNGFPEETNAGYGLAKKMMWVQLLGYRQQYDLRGIFLLPANMYGPRDHFDPAVSHVIPAIIRKIDDALRRNENVITLWGDGSPTREFLYAPDAARYIVALADRYDGIDPVNVGTGDEVSILETAERIAALMDFRGEIRWDRSRPNGQPRRSLDVSRLREVLGEQTHTPLDRGLHETIDWYRRAVEDGRSAD